MTNDSRSLIERIIAAGNRLGKLLMDGTNIKQGYSYHTANLIIGDGGDALRAEGVCLIPAVLSTRSEVATYTAGPREAIRWDVYVEMEMTLLCLGEERKFLWSGAGSDFSSADKAHAKAQTQGLKYFIRHLLQVAEGNEDGEHENGRGAESSATTSEGPPSVGKSDHAIGLRDAAKSGLPALVAYYNKHSGSESGFQAKWGPLFKQLKDELTKK